MPSMIGFLSATVLSAAALAQSPPDPLEACAQKADAAARLACFDQEMQRRHASNAPHPAPTATAAATAAAPAAAATAHAAAASPAARASTAPAATSAAAHVDENAGLSGPALRKKLHEQGVEETPKPKPIAAQVARAVWRPDHRYTLALDNGQVWEQVDEQQGVYVDAHDTVTISPGVLGAFFLETSKQKSFRVRRLQ
jgi:predicted flap endonuclease-1-like 5' DNA nuclease